MFGHLKAADFVNLMEGAELPAAHRAHIDACDRCRATWESMRSVHSELATLETDIPEPDWVNFRSAVRDELLSRSIQRQTAVRRWTGWTIRPAVAWALSLLMAIGITTATVLWKTQPAPAPAPAAAVSTAPGLTAVEPPVMDPTAEVIGAGPEMSLFDDVVSLGEEEQRRFREMLESAEPETRAQE